MQQVMVTMPNLSVMKRITMLRLISFKVCGETVAILLWLLEQARKGKLRGAAICYWTTAGTREVLLTGVYRAQPEFALAAADLIKVTAGHQLDLFH